MTVGVPELDDGHKEFFRHMSAIIAALHDQSFAEAERICRSMFAMAAHHSEAEEALLRRLDYPCLQNVIDVQVELAERLKRLLTLIIRRSPEAHGFAAGTLEALVAYLLRGDINFKSFIQEMRDAGRLTEPPSARKAG